MKYTLLAVLTVALVCPFAMGQMQPPPQQSPQTQPPTASASDSGTAVDQIKKMEEDWRQASLNKDRAAVERIEAADYVFVMPDGKVRTKEQDLAAIDKTNFTSFNYGDMNVRIFGDTAEVIGVAHIQGTDNGQDIGGDYRFTDVFVKRDGQWQAVSTEVTRITPQ